MRKPQQNTRERVQEMKFEKGLSVREIATILGISTQAVYLHLKALRDQPQEQAS
jgi:hypothetical protein